MIIFGTRLLGSTDAVPGVFRVATKFFHIDFLPLVPINSYLILAERGRRFQAIEIPVSGRSIAIAWLRTLGMIPALGTLIWMIIAFSDYNPTFVDCLPAVLSFIASACFAWFVIFHKCTNEATYERATELASHFDESVRPRVQMLVDRHFGMLPQSAAVIAVIDDDDDGDHDGGGVAAAAVGDDLELQATSKQQPYSDSHPSQKTDPLAPAETAKDSKSSEPDKLIV